MFSESFPLSLSSSFLLSPYGSDHLLGIDGGVGKRVCLQEVHARLLLERELVVNIAIFRVKLWHWRDEVSSVLLHSDRLIHLSDIVLAFTEGRLPVLLVHVVMIFWVLRAGAWCGVTIPERCANITWNTVPIVTADTPFYSECFPPVFPDGPRLLQNFFYHLWASSLIIN